MMLFIESITVYISNIICTIKTYIDPGQKASSGPYKSSHFLNSPFWLLKKFDAHLLAKSMKGPYWSLKVPHERSLFEKRTKKKGESVECFYRDLQNLHGGVAALPAGCE
jgi:hypothetical protein